MFFKGRGKEEINTKSKGSGGERGVKWTQWDTDRKELKYPYSTSSKISNHQKNTISFAIWQATNSFPPRLAQLPSFKGQVLVNIFKK